MKKSSAEITSNFLKPQVSIKRVAQTPEWQETPADQTASQFSVWSYWWDMNCPVLQTVKILHRYNQHETDKELKCSTAVSWNLSCQLLWLLLYPSSEVAFFFFGRDKQSKLLLWSTTPKWKSHCCSSCSPMKVCKCQIWTDFFKKTSTTYSYYHRSVSGDNFFLHLYRVSVPNVTRILLWLTRITQLHSQRVREFSCPSQGGTCGLNRPESLRAPVCSIWSRNVLTGTDVQMPKGRLQCSPLGFQ